MKKQFDGPSFVNPNHTSHVLNPNSTYQKPNINVTTNNKPYNGDSSNRFGWADEEEKKKTVTKNKPDFHNVESYFKKPEKAVEQPKSYQSHWEAENQRKIQSSTLSREYENKLINDVINAKGVTLKPNEVILKDFVKRLKSLDKDIITDILFQKIDEFLEIGDMENVKMLIKCLYMIEEIISNKIDGYENIFKTKIDLFENLASVDNKKVKDIANNILNTLTGHKNKSSKSLENYSESNKFTFIKKKENKGLIEFDTPVTNTVETAVTEKQPEITNIFDFKQNPEVIPPQANNLSNTFSFVKKKAQIEESPVTPIIPVNNDNILNQIFSSYNTESKTEKSNFSFIKSTNEKPKEQPKEVSKEPIKNDMNDISNKLKELFIQDNIANLVQTTIPVETNYDSLTPTQKKYDAPNFDILFHKDAPSYFKQEVVEQNKIEKKVDHFDFVNDLMKKK